MKKVISLVAALFIVVSVTAQPKQLRVLTFNILHGATLKGDFDLDLIAKVIKDANPDIVAMQEVDWKTNRAKKLDLVTELGLRTGMLPFFGQAMHYDGGGYGEGVLCKHVVSYAKNHLLSYTKGNEPRSALEVRFIKSGLPEITFVATHLDHTSGGDRVSQVKDMTKLFKGKKNLIIAGDLNATPESKAISILKKRWNLSAGDNFEPTYPSKAPKVKIDYIMMSKGSNWKVKETKVIDEKVASDHCPYLVVYEYVGN